MNKTKKLIIIGTGETGLLAYEFFTHDSEYEVVGFSVNRAYLKESIFQNLPVVAFEELETLYPPKEYEAFVALSSSHLNRDRTKVYDKAKEKGYHLASYISSDALVWHNVEIGENCLVLGASILQPFSKIGNNVFLWYKSIIGHHSVVEDNCFFASAGIAGFCHVGMNCFLGGGCLIGENIRVGKDNYISMGTVLSKNTRDNSIYRGNPAKKVKDFSATYFCQVKEGE